MTYPRIIPLRDCYPAVATLNSPIQKDLTSVIDPAFGVFISSAKDPSQAGDPVEAMFDADKAQNRAAYLHTKFPPSAGFGGEVNTYWRLATSRQDTGYVYFLAASELNRVKIGFSRDVAQRIATLRHGSPCDLTLIGTVKAIPRAEAALHDHLSKSWVFGEWFHHDERVAAAIRSARSPVSA